MLPSRAIALIRQAIRRFAPRSASYIASACIWPPGLLRGPLRPGCHGFALLRIINFWSSSLFSAQLYAATSIFARHNRSFIHPFRSPFLSACLRLHNFASFPIDARANSPPIAAAISFTIALIIARRYRHFLFLFPLLRYPLISPLLLALRNSSRSASISSPFNLPVGRVSTFPLFRRD